MKRILLFLLTNLAVVLVISVIFSVFGIGNVLDQQGIDLDLPSLLIYSSVIGFTGSLVSLAMSKTMAKRSTGCQNIEDSTDPEAQWIVSRVRAHAEAAGIGMPEVCVFQANEPNAFATGMRRDSALVAVSTGLLRGMHRNEVDAVIGHEVAHIANGDMVTLTLIQGVVNTFVVFFSRVIGHVVDRTVFRTERGHGPGYWIVSLAAQMLLGILASIIVCWFSRQREFRADEGGARFAGAENMIAALERLKGGTAELPEGMAAMGIGGSGMARLFSTHPPLDERIAALRANRG
ncbi:MAG: protease HtpX [Myxococcota bacterium]